MDIQAEFKNGQCKLYMIPTDEWEQRLVGAIAKGGESLDAIVTYKPQGHYSYGKCEVVSILLTAK